MPIHHPFQIPSGSTSHVESMVTTVPGSPDAEYAVWAVQPELKETGRTASVSVSDQVTMSDECLATSPRWDKSWQIPLTYDTTLGAPTVRGGDRRRIDCEYGANPGPDLTLAEETCRAMLGLVPIE